jgi:hypothetical protein
MYIKIVRKISVSLNLVFNYSMNKTDGETFYLLIDQNQFDDSDNRHASIIFFRKRKSNASAPFSSSKKW